jgi:hypothetical protein
MQHRSTAYLIQKKSPVTGDLISSTLLSTLSLLLSSSVRVVLRIIDNCKDSNPFISYNFLLR